ncbi:hypothetical protein [Streptomyces syringium]|uniref:Uncharacterized protein n=1 Tax=Streptomyces syringium TaxID=76729 RepID=A0ABS4Y9J0_9ACTN|nr:hypothetical protein [Streptomyces syringium]MBP2404563.1 hypothetical protein [Streptomyces syringium]
MRNPIPRLFAWMRAHFPSSGHTPQAATAPAPTPSEPRLDGSLTGGDAALWVTPHGIDIRPRHSPRPQVAANPRKVVEAEAFDIAPGTMVVDTVTGGMGRVRTVGANGMISVEHPNGYTWKTCAVRAANSIERLNLLAADAAQASRTH